MRRAHCSIAALAQRPTPRGAPRLALHPSHPNAGAEISHNTLYNERKYFKQPRQRFNPATRRRHRDFTRMKIVVAIAFILILASLASALIFLMRDKGKSNRTVQALTLRVGFSVALFLFILLSYKLGWIQPTGIR
jgi:hypothetical protein